MAPSLRTRLTALVGVGLLVACTRDAAQAAPMSQPVPSAQPERQPPRDEPAAATIESILTRALGQAREQFANAALQLRAMPNAAPAGDATTLRDADADPRSVPSTPPMTLLLAADGRFRVDHPDGRVEVLTSAAAFTWRALELATELDEPARKRLFALREQTRALVFEPLRRARASERTSPHQVRFETTIESLAAGAEPTTSPATETTRWTLDHRTDATGLPIPVVLRSPQAGTIEFVELGAPPALLLPRVVVLTMPDATDAAGQRFHVRLLGTDADHQARVFERPTESATSQPDLMIAATDRPLRPEWQLRPARESLWVRDPGDWPARRRACEELGMRLHRAGQKNGGDPFLQHDVDGAWLVIPFRASTTAPYEPTAGEVVRKQVEHHVAVVLAPTGETFAERVTSGTGQLDEFVAQAGRSNRCGLRIVVNVFFETGLGERPEVERTMDIRLERPIE